MSLASCIRDLMPRDDRDDEGLVADIGREILPLLGTNRAVHSLRGCTNSATT